MDQTWNKLIKGLDQIAANFKDFNYELHPGVTEKKIISLEKIIGKSFPEDFKNFYKVHNGENSNGQGILKGEEFLSMERIQEEWNVWKELLDNNTFTDEEGDYKSDPAAGIKDDWWNVNWIPFTYDGYGNHICIDLDPTEDGNYGQIIRMWHDEPERELLANSFNEWINEYADQIENDEFTYSDDYGIIHKSELEELNEE